MPEMAAEGSRCPEYEPILSTWVPLARQKEQGDSARLWKAGCLLLYVLALFPPLLCWRLQKKRPVLYAKFIGQLLNNTFMLLITSLC